MYIWHYVFESTDPDNIVVYGAEVEADNIQDAIRIASDRVEDNYDNMEVTSIQRY